MSYTAGNAWVRHQSRNPSAEPVVTIAAVVKPFVAFTKNRYSDYRADRHHPDQGDCTSPTAGHRPPSRTNGELPRRHDARKRVRHRDNQPDDEGSLVERHIVDAKAEQREQGRARGLAKGNQREAGAENSESAEHHERPEHAQEERRRAGLSVAPVSEVVASDPPSGRHRLGQDQCHENDAHDYVHGDELTQTQQRGALNEKCQQQDETQPGRQPRVARGPAGPPCRGIGAMFPAKGGGDKGRPGLS